MILKREKFSCELMYNGYKNCHFLSTYCLCVSSGSPKTRHQGRRIFKKILEEMPVKNKGEDTEECWECLQNKTQVWHMWKEREKKEDWERRTLDYRVVLKIIWTVRCKIVNLKSPIRIAQCVLQWTCAGPCTVPGTGAGHRKPGLSRRTVDPEAEWTQRKLSVNYTPCSNSEQHTPMAATLVILKITFPLWLFN